MLWSFAFLLFSILGTALFAGQLYSCSDNGAGTDAIHASVNCYANSTPSAEWYQGKGPAWLCDSKTNKRLLPPIIDRVQCSGTFLTAYGRGREGLYYGYKGSGTEILVPRAWLVEP
eukprot:2779228-Rhodomonas_salina.1